MTHPIQQEYDHSFKIIIVGDTQTGKSQLLGRFADNNFNDKYVATIGVDFRAKKLNIHDKTVTLHMWDTAGQERYGEITKAYYKDAAIVFLVYDKTNRETFNNIDEIWEKILSTTIPKNATRVLVGNKSDLTDRPAVTTEQGQTFANQKGWLFFETSAKTADNVTGMLTAAVKKHLEKVNSSEQTQQSTTSTSEQETQQPPTLEALQVYYASQRKGPSCCSWLKGPGWLRFNFFANSSKRNYIKALRTRAKNNPNGASKKTLSHFKLNAHA